MPLYGRLLGYLTEGLAVATSAEVESETRTAAAQSGAASLRFLSLSRSDLTRTLTEQPPTVHCHSLTSTSAAFDVSSALCTGHRRVMSGTHLPPSICCIRAMPTLYS